MSRPPFDPPSVADIDTVSRQLGRPARGVIGIAARCVCGAPTVAATSPRLDDGATKATADGQPISTKLQTTRVDWVRTMLSSVLTAGLTDAPANKLVAPVIRGQGTGTHSAGDQRVQR